MGSHWSAFDAVQVKRGSTQMTWAPRSCARLTVSSSVVAAAAFLTAPDQDAVGVVAVPAGVLGLVAVKALAGEIAAHPAKVAHAERGGGPQLKPQLVDCLELQHVAAGAVLVRDGVPSELVADLRELLGRLL